MLYLTAQTKILLAIEPVNFKKQIDGLIALCENHLHQQPRSGELFVFINRAKTMVRILCYERNGYWLATKRLSRGRYRGWPTGDDTTCSLPASEFNKLLKRLLALPDQVS
jgi:transposase